MLSTAELMAVSQSSGAVLRMRVCLRIVAICAILLCFSLQLTHAKTNTTTHTLLAAPRSPAVASQSNLSPLSAKQNVGLPPRSDDGDLDASSCVPELKGWDLVRGATLTDVGYHAAAISVGRHVLVMGGVHSFGGAIDAFNYTERYTERGLNMFDPEEGTVAAVAEVIAMKNSVACPYVASMATAHAASPIAVVEQALEGVDNTSLVAEKGYSHVAQEGPAPLRCIEPQDGESTRPARLLVPVVGSSSVVRVQNRLYAIGACNLLPDGVSLDLLRNLTSTSRSDPAMRNGTGAHGTRAVSPEAQAVEGYLRSVLEIQFYQRKRAAAEEHTVYQTLYQQPPTMTLRVNASCVVGAHDIVYIIGGVNARTGEALASVAQFDTVSKTFVEGVWLLDQPVITPAVASDNGLVFLSGGFSSKPDPSIFDPSRQRRDLHTSVAVLDTQRGVFDGTVARYAAEAQSLEWQWTAPQLFARGAALFMLGTGGRQPYRGVAYWSNMSASPASLQRFDAARIAGSRRSDREVAAEVPSRKTVLVTQRQQAAVVKDVIAASAARSREAEMALLDGLTQTDTVAKNAAHNSTPSLAYVRGGRDRDVFEYAEFSLVPARRDAVLALLPTRDAAVVELYLFGGRAPAAAAAAATLREGEVTHREIFRATVRLCSAAHVTHADGAGNTVKAASADAPPPAPRLLGFSYKRVMATTPLAGATALTTVDAERAYKAEQEASQYLMAAGNSSAVANSDGDTCVSVNGHLPVWYNVSFSLLLSYDELRQSCPGILAKASATPSPLSPLPHGSETGHDAAPTFSPCAVLLSTSPRCDEPVAEFTHLSPLNAKPTQVASYDSEGRVIGHVSAFAIAQTLLLGSLERGIVHVLATGEDGREHPTPVGVAVPNTTLHILPGRQPTALSAHSANTAGDSNKALFYEQTFLHVCFSRRSSAVANCGVSHVREPALTTVGVVTGSSEAGPPPIAHANARDTAAVGDGDVPCSTRFYETLTPTAAWILSPELPCSNGSDSGGSTDPPEEPTSHLLRQWMFIAILAVLLVAIVAYLLVSFVLMPGYAFTRTRYFGGNGNGIVGRISGHGMHGGGGGGTTYAEQQRSLLPYREARIFLGVGAGGGGGAVFPGPLGAEGLAEDDVPDEYETALAAAGVSAGLTGFEASWAGNSEGAARQRRLLDGKYEVMKKLGKGSFSVVYLVRRITDNATFALKYLQCSDDVDRHEAMKECEVVYALQGHPNVIQLFDMFMSYRFDRHMVTVPRSRKSRATVTAAAAAEGGNKKRRRSSEDGRRRTSDDATTPLSPSSAAAAAASSSTSTTAGATETNHESSAGPEKNPVRSRDGSTKPTSPGADAAADAQEAHVAKAQAGLDRAVSEQPLMLTESSSNATSAATSTTSRPVVHMDSAYLDAMTAGVLRDEHNPESPTTPKAASAAKQQQQQQQQHEKQKENDKEEDRQLNKPVHERGLSSLQAERYLSLVMAYHERGDLARWVRQRRALQPLIPEATIVSIAFQVLSLLSYMHHRHQPPIIHRDLKPENILLTTHVHYENVNDDFLPIVVTDFGLSRVMDKTFCETGVGSLPYVAPECWQRRYSTKVDIWALGCVLYAVCSKRVDSSNVKVMFSECTQADFHTRLRYELENIYGYSDSLAWFITALLAVKPDDRPTASEALRMLRTPAMDSNGQPRFRGPPLAALLRPPTADKDGTTAAGRLRHDGRSVGGQPRSQEAMPTHSYHERPTPLPTSAFLKRDPSLASVAAFSHSEASVSPLDGRQTPPPVAGESSVPPIVLIAAAATATTPAVKDMVASRGNAASGEDVLRSLSATTTAAAAADALSRTLPRSGNGEAVGSDNDVHVVVSSVSLSGPPSTRVASTMPPHSAQRTLPQRSASPSDAEGCQDDDCQPERLPVPSIASTAPFCALSPNGDEANSEV